MVQGRNTLGYLRNRTIYVTGHSTYRKESMLTNMHRSQNVWHVHLEKCKKKSLNIHSHVRPNTRNAPTMSSQILGVRGCWLSNLSDISLEWVGYFGRDMFDLRVWVLIHLECTVLFLKTCTHSALVISNVFFTFESCGTSAMLVLPSSNSSEWRNCL